MQETGCSEALVTIVQYQAVKEFYCLPPKSLYFTKILGTKQLKR